MKKILALIVLIFLSINSAFAADIDLSKFSKTKEYANFYLVNESNKAGILMKNGEYLILPTEENVEVIAYLYSTPIVKFRDEFYFVDKDFEVYKVFNYRGGGLFFVIQKNGKYGLLKDEGDDNIVLEPIYDFIEILEPYWLSHDGQTDEYTIIMWAKIRKGAWYGYYDFAKNELSEFKYSDLRSVKKGKFNKMNGWVHYYLQKKTKLGWQYVGGKFYKEIPKRLWEDTVLYYGLFGCVWDSMP